MEQAKPPSAQDQSPVFRELEFEDLPRMVELAQRFFDESEFKDFATFSPESILLTFEAALSNPRFATIVFAPDGVVEGFSAFQFESSYTVEPLALGYLFYVSPEHRRGPAGRLLLDLSVNYAKQYGAVAFYNGAMAGIDSVSNTLPNLYRKMGFEPLFWGRKILKED